MSDTAEGKKPETKC